MQTLQSLKKNSQCKKVCAPHTSTVDLSPPSPNTHQRIFEHKTILTCSTTSRHGKRDHHLLPHAFLSPDPAALPAQGCTLSMQIINLSAGWKNPCIRFSQVISQTMVACQITPNNQLMQHCLFNFKRFLSAYLNVFWTSHLCPNLIT